jgi:hypothetical protein
MPVEGVELGYISVSSGFHSPVQESLKLLINGFQVKTLAGIHLCLVGETHGMERLVLTTGNNVCK